ncbi:hypothetical protein V866_004053 [Kwoniella sp. B9012]
MTTETSARFAPAVDPLTGSSPLHHCVQSDSESDLTDLSDIGLDEDDPQSLQGESFEEDVKPIVIKRQASPTWDNDTDADSDYEAKPTKKKAKKRPSTSKASTSKTKVNEKGKGKLKKKRGKKIVDPDEEENKPKRKVVLAKQVHWRDIPDWGDRTDCPLLRLPEDVLDMCFGLTSGLGVRDYVALAGVSRYFRHHFTPDVFHSICWSRETHRVSTFSFHGSRIAKPETPVLASHIFSREVEDWKVELPKKIYKYGNPTHYIPAGPRKDWSEAQYIVYKEEQTKWRRSQRDAQVQCIKEKMDQQEQEDKNNEAFVMLNGRSRRVLAVVKGREDGEPATEKDRRGIPIRVKEAPNEFNTDPDIEDFQEKEENKNKRNDEKSRGRLTRSKRWTVPDTDTEEEYEILPDQYINEDEVLIYDHWPNKWRDLAVQWINDKRINKSEAIRVYKVTESELLCLKHVLVTNPMSTKTPQQVFLEAAVEALAWRSHGGEQGYKQYIQDRSARLQQNAQKRQDKIEKAKKDGTYVYKHKKRQIAPYDWWWREDIIQYRGGCESNCEACARENDSDYTW